MTKCDWSSLVHVWVTPLADRQSLALRMQFEVHTSLPRTPRESHRAGTKCTADPIERRLFQIGE